MDRETLIKKRIAETEGKAVFAYVKRRTGESTRVMSFHVIDKDDKVLNMNIAILQTGIGKRTKDDKVVRNISGQDPLLDTLEQYYTELGFTSTQALHYANQYQHI